jgi:uncharacterized membrane protein YdbT with pleckstrin-like domain
MRLLKEIIADLSQQIWTLVGLFSAWLVLTGSAKQVVGYAILTAVVLWIATYSIRHPKDKS